MREDKEELLDSYSRMEEEKSKIGGYDIFIVFFIFFLILSLLFPKIYIANQIYYKSITVNKLLDHYEILKEENRLLKQKLEQQKFKNQILDTIF